MIYSSNLLEGSEKMSKQILDVKLLTIAEVCNFLAVSRVAFNRYEKAGLATVTIGGRKYVAEQNLRKFLLGDTESRAMQTDCKVL